MNFVPVPSQAQIQAALLSMLAAILPPTVDIAEGQDNNVPEPSGDYVLMTVVMRNRLSTNVDTYADCKFAGSITNGLLSVSQLSFGALAVGNVVFGTGTSPDPAITAVNADGTATLSAPITLANSWLAAGTEILTQPTDVAIQLDVHSENIRLASDYAQTITTIFRDDRGYQMLRASGFPISPLYTDDPKQVPFVSGESQYESRYVITAHLQVDQTLTLPQEFMDRVDVDRIPADLFYAA